MTSEDRESEWMVRSVHPYGFRSGEWGEILTTVPSHGRDCYLIRWADGVTDWWPVEDPTDQREFRTSGAA